MASINVWLVGAGPHARAYAKVLQDLKVPFDVIGRGEDSAASFEKETGYRVHPGGLESFLKSHQLDDKHNTLAIVSVTVSELCVCTTKLIHHGINRILLEKPGGKDALEINTIHDAIESARRHQNRNVRVSIAYNRRFYSSVLMAREMIKQDGGVKSFVFEFTEWSHVISALPHSDIVKSSWFLANSSHILDLAFFMGGQPRTIKCFNSGKGDVTWHPQASTWVGSGITDSNALFSYHANWAGPGRWWLEIVTTKNRYIFRPLEKLHITRLGSVKIEEVEIDDSLDKNFKPGLWRQTKTFLEDPDHIDLLSLEKHLHHVTSIYEPIRGFPDKVVDQATSSVLIIGLGNIGSRHLQALAKMEFAVDITCVEIHGASLERARKIYEAEPKIHPQPTVKYYKSVVDIVKGKTFDICIIATCSDVRRMNIETVLERFKVKYMILEKVLFQTADDHFKVRDLLVKHGVHAYVNAHWGASPMGRYVKQNMKEPVNLHVQGNGWGLCCNAIHLLHYAMFLNNSKDVTFGECRFDPGYEECKRPGFLELYGSLVGTIKTSSSDAKFEIVCKPGDPMIEGRVVKLSNKHGKSDWSERTGILCSNFSDFTAGLENKSFVYPLISNWTHIHVKHLLETGVCDLPNYEDLYTVSMALNNVFMTHLRKEGNTQAENGICPIT